MQIASQNMRGRGNELEDGINKKWWHINQIMKYNKIGILAIQEAHMTDDFAQDLERVFDKRLQVRYSQGANKNAAGVAFVINKERTVINGTTDKAIIPGRAMSLSIPWHKNKTLTILNVYAPNSTSENAQFWEDLKTEFEKEGAQKPDIMMGDFNITEDAIDRLPCRKDKATPITALENLKGSLGLIDGWRTTYPDTKAYSYEQKGTGSQSRIDRIYVSRKVLETAEDWDSTKTAIETDHKMVTVKITDPALPYLGKGRWPLPLFLVDDKEFMTEATRLGTILQSELNDIKENRTNRTDEKNAQTLWTQYKDKLTGLAKARAKVAVPKMQQRINALKSDVKKTHNDKSMDEDQRIQHSAMLEQEIENLETKRHNKARTASKAKDILEGEVIGPHWTGVNKARKPREMIYAIKKLHTAEPEYERRSNKMANIAGQHHEEQQTEGLDPDPVARADAQKDIIDLIDCKLDEEGKQYLREEISIEDIEKALKCSANGTATGLDGFPYEFWKALHENWTIVPGENAEEDDHPFDILSILETLYQDIETSGVATKRFAEGWLCPLYKKNDRRDIANYRPITLLNTDYKIYTKILAQRLAKVTHQVVHTDQAGFMPGRNIHNHTRLAHLVTEYAEAVEEDGLIIALDQEKAYDKICHAYLFDVMEKYNFPENLIKSIKSLYDSAETIVILNGVKSEPFKVTRGVRQGDPMSCLLFNIAIEPLANALRKSPKLKGYTIPGLEERIIATLFADDTTIYLSKDDKFEDLKEILDKWCKASGARFNVMKTEIIPIGSPGYREKVISTRVYNEVAAPIDASVHIAKDREPVRLLGAWIGNDVDDAAVWSKNLDKIREALERWQKSNPTMMGKRHIINMTVGGITQYMTAAQGMPERVEKSIAKMMTDFLWDGKRASLSLDNLARPLEEGGLKILDLRARNEAIDIIWLKGYLTLGPERPKWAAVADILVERSAKRTHRNMHAKTVTNVFTQTWEIALHSKSKMAKCLKRMMKTGRKYNVSFTGLKIPENIKSQMPCWYHIGTEDHPTGLHRRLTSTCLKDQHATVAVADLITITARIRDRSPGHRHLNRTNCACLYCKEDRNKGCEAPNKCAAAAQQIIDLLKPKWKPCYSEQRNDGLSLTPQRKAENAEAQIDGSAILFDPSINPGNEMSTYFRIFVDPNATCHDPATRPQKIPGTNTTKVTVYTDGSFQLGNDGEPRTGSGIWYGDNDPRNADIRVPGPKNSNQIGELAAALYVLKVTPCFDELHIISDSKYVIDGLTKNLRKWEEIGFIGIENKELWKATIATARERGAPIKLEWVKGHSGVKGNEEADKLADQGAKKDVEDEVDTEISPKFNLTGAQLSSMTQAIAYTGIRSQKTQKERSGTLERLEMTRYAAQENFGFTPTHDGIWSALRSQDISRKIRNFFWKTMHKSQKIGSWWDRIPDNEHKAYCQDCERGTIEDMTHILLECNAIGNKVVWSMAKVLCEMKGIKWPELRNTGSILACCLAKFQTPEGENMPGEDRLYKIIISESAFLIWKLRNRRYFDGPDDQLDEDSIKRMWLAVINERLRMDQVLTSKKYKNKALKRKTVLKTWRKTLKGEKDLPKDWTTQTGVLVGIPPPERRSRRNQPVAPL